jgi:dTDP-4-amino-4,6-dideoxygalactose transaminase
MREYFGGNTPHLPVTDVVSGSLLRLPLFAHLSDEDVDYVLEHLHEVVGGYDAAYSLGLPFMK